MGRNRSRSRTRGHDRRRTSRRGGTGDPGSWRRSRSSRRHSAASSRASTTSASPSPTRPRSPPTRRSGRPGCRRFRDNPSTPISCLNQDGATRSDGSLLQAEARRRAVGETGREGLGETGPDRGRHERINPSPIRSPEPRYVSPTVARLDAEWLRLCRDFDVSRGCAASRWPVTGRCRAPHCCRYGPVGRPQRGRSGRRRARPPSPDGPARGPGGAPADPRRWSRSRSAAPVPSRPSENRSSTTSSARPGRSSSRTRSSAGQPASPATSAARRCRCCVAPSRRSPTPPSAAGRGQERVRRLAWPGRCPRRRAAHRAPPRRRGGAPRARRAHPARRAHVRRAAPASRRSPGLLARTLRWRRAARRAAPRPGGRVTATTMRPLRQCGVPLHRAAGGRRRGGRRSARPRPAPLPRGRRARAGRPLTAWPMPAPHGDSLGRQGARHVVEQRHLRR